MADGRSTGGQPQGLTGPYPLSGPLRTAGYLWRDLYISGYLSRMIGATFTGAPTVNRGVELNGTTQFVSYTNDAPLQPFSVSQHFWAFVITPDFEADDGNEHVIFDGEAIGGGSTVFGIRKLNAAGTNALRMTLPGTNTDIALGSYQASWNVDEMNTLVVNVGKTGGTETLLNGVQVDQTAVIFAPQGIDEMRIGVDRGEASGFFDGTINSIVFGLGELTAADAAELEED
jgi:hypothetical protein